ncbi:MAG: hypothetical protein ABIH67_00225 [Candidatus Uhrbacteria bacterium]
MNYKHTQIGKLMIVVTLIMFLYFGYIFQKVGYEPIVFITSILVILILISFASLTVTIDQEFLRIKFGYGIFKKSFRLDQIASVKTARHHWYYGWGIRYCLKPPMWIYNVSGFDAVEIKMKNGKVFRIGTDEPQELEQAITQSI